MVNIDELRVTNDGEQLIIKAHIDQTYYQDDTGRITEIWVGVGDETFNTSLNPSSNAYKVYQGAGITSAEYTVLSGRIDGGLKSGLIFVYFRTYGNPIDCNVCSFTQEWQVRVTTYMKPIYEQFMSQIKELGNTCQIPQGLIDNILRFKAVNAAVDCGHYTQAIDYYNRFFGGGTSANIAQVDCGCHG